jgi:prefoldin subunit 5
MKTAKKIFMAMIAALAIWGRSYDQVMKTHKKVVTDLEKLEQRKNKQIEVLEVRRQRLVQGIDAAAKEASRAAKTATNFKQFLE